MYVRLFAAIWLLLCAFLAVIAWGFQAPFAYDPVGPRAYPLLLLVLMAAGAAWLIFKPGPQTEAYLAKAVNRITLPGAVFIAIIAILPYILLWAADVQNFPFAGTSVLISVGVALELMRQIDSQLMLRNYEGFLK